MSSAPACHSTFSKATSTLGLRFSIYWMGLWLRPSTRPSSLGGGSAQCSPTPPRAGEMTMARQGWGSHFLSPKAGSGRRGGRAGERPPRQVPAPTSYSQGNRGGRAGFSGGTVVTAQPWLGQGLCIVRCQGGAWRVAALAGRGSESVRWVLYLQLHEGRPGSSCPLSEPRTHV